MFVSVEIVDERRRDPRGQGDLGEMIAAGWFVEQGASVFTPLFHTNAHFDFVVDRGMGPERIQVKTSTRRQGERWVVEVRTQGGNRSWSGVVKRPDARRFDYLFAVVGNGRRWLIPAEIVDGRSRLNLGCERYSEWEIEPGRPLVSVDAPLD